MKWPDRVSAYLSVVDHASGVVDEAVQGSHLLHKVLGEFDHVTWKRDGKSWPWNDSIENCWCRGNRDVPFCTISNLT